MTNLSLVRRIIIRTNRSYKIQVRVRTKEGLRNQHHLLLRLKTIRKGVTYQNQRKRIGTGRHSTDTVIGNRWGEISFKITTEKLLKRRKKVNERNSRIGV